jgi:protein PhnA
MTDQMKCPRCTSEYTYQDRDLWVCSTCAHEWNPESIEANEENVGEVVVKDASGNILKDGDSVTVIKDLKVKGSSSSIKVGTKVKSIRIIDGVDGHNIACKIDGFGAMNLKSEFVRKA